MPVKRIYSFLNPSYFYVIDNIGEDAFKEATLGTRFEAWRVPIDPNEKLYPVF